MQFETVEHTVAYQNECQDRVGVFSSNDRTVLIVADGAGGTGDGASAAQLVVDEVKGAFRRIENANGWCELLLQIDTRITSGESTAVVVDIRSYGISGASVGDSRAWIVAGDQVADLTQAQSRKPLLGSRAATPVAFTHQPLGGVLIAASDGFFNYAKQDAVVKMIAQSNFYSIPNQCIEMVRLPSGDLWDDIGIIAARVKPKHRTRQRYAI